MIGELLKQLPQLQMGQQFQMPQQMQQPQMDMFGQSQNSGMLSQALRGQYGGFKRFF